MATPSSSSTFPSRKHPDDATSSTPSPSFSSAVPITPSTARSRARKRTGTAPDTIDMPTRSGSSTPISDDDFAQYPRRIILERDPHEKGGKRRPGLLGGKQRPSYTVRAPGTPFNELDLSEVDFLKMPDEETKKGITRYRRSFFLVGILLGAAVAWLASQNASMEGHIRTLRTAMDDQLVHMGVDFSSVDFSLRMPKEFAELRDNLFRPKDWLATQNFKVGRQLAAEGYRAEYPVVLLPGIISTGLESWNTGQDVSQNFRKRLWGTTTMMRTIVLEKDMWVRHLALDPHTGLDPPGIKVRAAEGLDAASFFLGNYWIWGRIIENLAVIGYDPNTMYMAAYDWRLSYANLEVRDQYFTRLKLRIEQNLALSGKKTVLVAHSMGSSVALYFMKWVEASGPGFGNAGDQWVETHLETFVSIAGTFLGVPKAMAALLSGEMRDTVEVPPGAAFLLEKFFSRRERARLFRSWAGSAGMIIKGGDAVWGNATWAPDDDQDATETHGSLYTFRLPSGDNAVHLGAGDASDGRGLAANSTIHEVSSQVQVQGNLSADAAITWLLQHTPSTFQRMVQLNYSNGMEFDEEQIRKNNQDPRTWSNPLEIGLPNAPSMKVISLYGVGKPTERAYFYEKGPFEQEDTMVEGRSAVCTDATCTNETEAIPLGFPTARMHWIDTTVHDDRTDSSPKIRAGCKMGDGDGTVSLLSLGAMNVEGWKKKRYNPAGCKIVTYELKHEPEGMDLRGGPKTADHVDILGAAKVNEIVLRVAAGRADEVEDHFVSDIREYAARIDWEGTSHGATMK